MRTTPSSRQRGQLLLELLLVAGAIILALVLLRQPLVLGLRNLFGESAQAIGRAELALRSLTSPVGGPAQEGPQGPPLGGPVGGGGVGPGSAPRPQPPGSLDDTGRGGGGGGGAGGPGGPVAPRPPGPLPGPGPGPGRPDLVITLPTAVERALIDAAIALLRNSPITFALFDFTSGRVVTRAVSEIVNEVMSRGIPIRVGNLGETIGALAAVFFDTNADGTVNTGAPIQMVFDRPWLAGATTEQAAAVFAHEGWHVAQLFNGISNDFLNYPRVVDIEYEAFVVGAAVWDAVKGDQSERALDGGSACVAQGEARCKEILVTDFGYPPGPRRGGSGNLGYAS